MCLRNPWGRKEWKGPWSDYSTTWERYPYIDERLRTRQQQTSNNANSQTTLGAADDGRFWILFKDFFQFFNSVTVSYSRDDYHHVTIAENIPDETWGVSRLVLPDDCELAFVSLY